MRIAILAGLVVLLAGCGADEKASLSGPLTYERGGGLAGRRDRLVVKPDGSATLTVREKSKAVKLTGKELDTLAADLEAADLGSVRSESTSERPVPDAFGYRVSYGGDTVTTDSAAMPKQLRAPDGAARRARRPLRAIAALPGGTGTGPGINRRLATVRPCSSRAPSPSPSSSPRCSRSRPPRTRGPRSFHRAGRRPPGRRTRPRSRDRRRRRSTAPSSAAAG